MKKRIITALTALLTGLCNIMPCVAAENPVVSVSSTAAKPGDTVEITVDLEGCEGFTNIAIEVGYNADVIELLGRTENLGSVSSGPLSRNPYNMSWNPATYNNVGFIEFNGTLVTMQFKVKETSVYGTYPITVDFYKGRADRLTPYVDGKDCNYIEPKGEARRPLKLQYQNGSITVTDKNIISASDISFGRTKTEFSVNAVALGEFDGKLIAAFKDEKGVLKAVRMYDAQPTTQISYDGACDYADVMWWDMNLMTPIAEPITVKQ